MAVSSKNSIHSTYKEQYVEWRRYKNLQAAKRQEYLRRNPDAIKDYDLQRAKILLSAVDMMDKSISKKSDKVSIAFESATNLGLGYAAIGGSALGFLLSKLNFFKKNIDKFTQKFPKSANFITMGITAISGVLGVVIAYPAYNFLNKIESKIYRKRRIETMEKELQDPRIFAVLDEKQKEIFLANLKEVSKDKKKNTISSYTKNEFKNIKQIAKETWHYNKAQNEFKEKYAEDKTFYDEHLTEKEIKGAKKDKVLLLVLIRELNTKAQSYSERIERLTNNLIAISFTLGSLFALGYERIAKSFKLKTSSLPAGIGLASLAISTFFATWAQKNANLVGRYKAKQELMNHPEQLVYISNKKVDNISDEEIEIEENTKNKNNDFKFLKQFLKDNKEYKEWKKSSALTGKDISKAMEDIEISPEQFNDGKRLQQNMFKTFYKIDTNTQNFSNKIDMINETIKYPTTIFLGTIGSVWGMKHLANLRHSTLPKDILKHTAKYIGTISLFAIPTLLINSYFAKTQKMGARVSDMMTMKDLEDYRFFADYSRFKDK